MKKQQKQKSLSVEKFLAYYGKAKNKFVKSETRKNVSDFVKRMREIDAIPRERLLWYSKEPGIEGKPSMKGNTYIRVKHGELK